MKLSDWLGLERGRSAALAEHLNIKPPQVADWISGKKPVPVTHMSKIEGYTNREVTRQEMCPDDWQGIWPELAAAQSPPAPPAIEAIAPKGWDGVDRRQLTKQVINPADGRREIDRPDGFPVIAGV
jgi:DNA-binding transcriptional regulator YdaS (Cro superfamily)